MGFEPVKCPPECIYSMIVPHSSGKGACGHCGYILITGQSRGCDPGPGCRHYRRGHRLGDGAIVVHKGGARFTWDVETGRRMYLKGKTDREIADALGTKRDAVGHSDGESECAFHQDIGSTALVFVGTRGRQVGWLASQSDMLADDWHIVE